MGRPVIIFQRLTVPGSVTPGQPSAETPTNPNDLSPPEDMDVDYIVLEEENGAAADLAVTLQTGQRKDWSNDPLPITSYNNIPRGIGADEAGEHWLDVPFFLTRRHSISIRMQNRMVGQGCRGWISFQGTGCKTGKPYDMTIPFELAAGTVDGIYQTFGGRFAAVTGDEDIEVHGLMWFRHPDSQAWNPRLIGLQIEPSGGQAWSGPGTTGGGAGSFLPPLYAYSNVRGPAVACFYKPPGGILEVADAQGKIQKIERGVTLLQSDVITFQFINLAFNVPRFAHITIIGTAKATIGG